MVVFGKSMSLELSCRLPSVFLSLHSAVAVSANVEGARISNCTFRSNPLF